MHSEPREPGASRDGASLEAGPPRLDWQTHRALRRHGFLWGGAAAGFLALAYVLILTAANSLEHALGDFLLLRYWMVPLIIGFGVQAGLFTYARGVPTGHKAIGTGGLAASGGVNTVAMVACCAHHLTDVLPLVGLAGAALFLVRYQSLFLLVGVLSSFVGTTYMLGALRRHALFPPQGSLLAAVLRFPFDRAVPAAIGTSALILVIAAASRLF